MLKSLIFEATQDCSFDCLHCYNAWKNEKPYPMGKMSIPQTLQMWEKIINETNVQLVTLTGGEPLLRENIFELIEYFYEKQINLNLITNGSLLDTNAIKKLIPNKISIFELPLLASNRDIHDKLSRYEGAFDKSTRSIVN